MRYHYTPPPARPLRKLPSFIILAVTFTILLGIVGSFDAAEESRQAEEYCEMVKSGLWPDYEGTFKDQCR